MVEVHPNVFLYFVNFLQKLLLNHDIQVQSLLDSNRSLT